MEILLVREPTCEGFTRGELFLDGEHECWTIEDEVRPVKIPGATAIPKGRYRVVLTKSPRFKKVLPEILEVPGYTGVRIHAGNTAADTEGCIIVGQRQGKAAVFDSQAAMLELMAALDSATEAGEQIWLTIQNADPS